MSTKATTNGRSGRKRHVFVLHDASSLRPRYDLFPEAHVTVLADPANHDTYTSPPEGTLLSLVYPRAHLDDVAALAREVHDERPIDRIFGLGFTTKPTANGLGLHYGACAARELHGSLTAHSDGAGTGAAFRLALPLTAVSPKPMVA